MEQKKIQAKFQLQDSYVKELSINTLEKFENKQELSISGKLGFRIIEIEKEGELFVGKIELVNDIKVNVKEENKANIHVAMIGIFTGNVAKDKFEEMLKLNGATTLSHIIRAYVYSATGLGGIPQIITPMVNFVEFFSDKNKKNNK